VWERTVDGQVLTFRLFGINNQNFIMRDEQTGTWWQQVTGEAIHGPLEGRRLTGVVHDEVSFGIWRAEQPRGRVLRPDPATHGRYEARDWERRMETVRTVVQRAQGYPLEPRAMVVGVEINERSKAYPFPKLLAQSPLVDRVGGQPIVVVIGEDAKSVRVFRTTVEGRPLSFLKKAGASPLRLIDAETASEWDFAGRAVSGTLEGRQLEKVLALKEYWFDWKIYHPDTALYTLGEDAASAGADASPAR
jgi:hypothetical protein